MKKVSSNLVLMCPTCGNTMKYMPRDKTLTRDKKKRCVYCGRNYTVVDQILKKE